MIGKTNKQTYRYYNFIYKRRNIYKLNIYISLYVYLLVKFVCPIMNMNMNTDLPKILVGELGRAKGMF